MLRKILFVLTSLAVAGMAGIANATLIGDEVTFEFLVGGTVFGGASFTFEVTEGTADTVLFANDSISANVEATSITIEITQNSRNIASNVEIVLSGLDWIGNPSGFLVGASISSQTGFFSTLPDSSLIVGPHAITLDLDPLASDFARNVGDILIIDFQTNHDSISEPASLALFGFALLGLGAMRRRRKTA